MGCLWSGWFLGVSGCFFNSKKGKSSSLSLLLVEESTCTHFFLGLLAMEKLVAAVVECDKPPQIKAALLQHIACGIPKQSDDEAITFFRICFRWRVFGPHSYRRPASDLLERFASLGPPARAF